MTGVLLALLVLVGVLACGWALTVWMLGLVVQRLQALEAAVETGRRAQLVAQAAVRPVTPQQVTHLAPLLREQIARRQAEAAAKAGKPATPPSRPDGPEAA